MQPIKPTGRRKPGKAVQPVQKNHLTVEELNREEADHL
jgi:hypothetical protein